jgi:hypothetical protein
VAPTPNDIEAEAARARARAEAEAITGRAEVDARAILAAAEADAAALRARAELEAEEHLRRAVAERDEARRMLEVARAEADDLLAQAADLRRRTEQETLRRLLATRADLHDAIERLREMTEPVLDLTDAATTFAMVPDTGAADSEALPDEVPVDASAAEAGQPDAGQSPGEEGDPVATLVRSAIGRAVDSASRVGPGWSGDRPAQWREQLRDGRNLL